MRRYKRGGGGESFVLLGSDRRSTSVDLTKIRSESFGLLTKTTLLGVDALPEFKQEQRMRKRDERLKRRGVLLGVSRRVDLWGLNLELVRHISATSRRVSFGLAKLCEDRTDR